MVKNKKIIAFDLDGTLSVSKRPVTEEMAHLVEELAKKIPVVIISGGTFNQFNTQFLPAFNREEFNESFVKNLFLLPTSGSQRYEYNLEKKEWVMTDIEPFSEDVKNKAKKILKDIIDSGTYDIPKNPIGEYVEDRITQLSISALGQEAPIEKKKLWDPDQKKRQKIKEILDKELPDTSIIIGGTTTIDILPKGFTKATGLIRLLDRMGLKKEDMLFVGDAIFPGGNDYAPKEVGMDTISIKGPEDTAKLIKEWII